MSMTTLDLKKTVEVPQEIQGATIKSALCRCVDCDKIMSQYAESCPHCGRFYQHFGMKYVTGIVKVDRAGWSWTIGWGIIAAGAILLVINGALLLVIFMFLLAGVAAGSR